MSIAALSVWFPPNRLARMLVTIARGPDQRSTAAMTAWKECSSRHVVFDSSCRVLLLPPSGDLPHTLAALRSDNERVEKGDKTGVVREPGDRQTEMTAQLEIGQPGCGTTAVTTARPRRTARLHIAMVLDLHFGPMDVQAANAKFNASDEAHANAWASIRHGFSDRTRGPVETSGAMRCH